MELYDYQHAAAADCRQAFVDGHNAILLVMPTGSGKTVTFAYMIKMAIQNGKRCMVLCNRSELIKQAKDKLNSLNLYPTIIDPSYGAPIVSQLYLASVDTLKRRQFPDIDLLIVDEAHFRTFDLIVMEYLCRGAKVIGPTATPVRKGKKHFDIDKMPEKYDIPAHLLESYSGNLGDIYTKIIEPTTISQLLEDGKLCAPIHYGPEVDTSGLVSHGGEDFTEKSLAEVYGKVKLYGDTIQLYNQHTPNTKALVFNVNVEISKRMTEEFRAAGISSMHLDGKETEARRKKILHDFENGEFAVLNNVGIATTGTDIPSIETVIVRRATLSLSLWLQMCGRGGRVYNGKTLSGGTKDFFNIIDMGGNIYRHGAWHWEREWSLDANGGSRGPKQAPIVVFCESCEALISPNISECPYCKAAQSKREAARKAEEEKIAAAAKFGVIDIDQKTKKPLSSMTIHELEQYREIKKYKLGWIVHQLNLRGRRALEDYATFKGYSPRWVELQVSNMQVVRNKAISDLVMFKKMNTHLTETELEEHAYKMLKGTHSESEIKVAINNLLERSDRAKVEW